MILLRPLSLQSTFLFLVPVFTLSVVLPRNGFAIDACLDDQGNPRPLADGSKKVGSSEKISQTVESDMALWPKSGIPDPWPIIKRTTLAQNSVSWNLNSNQCETVSSSETINPVLHERIRLLTRQELDADLQERKDEWLAQFTDAQPPLEPGRAQCSIQSELLFCKFMGRKLGDPGFDPRVSVVRKLNVRYKAVGFANTTNKTTTYKYLFDGYDREDTEFTKEDCFYCPNTRNPTSQPR
jgi:hypothetical protein